MMTHDVSQPVTAQAAVFTAIFVRALPFMTGVTGYRGQFVNARVRAHAGLLPSTRHNPSFRHCERTAVRIVLPAAVRIAPRRLAGRTGRIPPPPPVAAPSAGTTRAWGIKSVFSPHIPASLWGIPTYSRLARPGGAGSCAAIRSALEEYRLYRPGGCRACDGCHSCAGETRHPFPNGALNDANRQ